MPIYTRTAKGYYYKTLSTGNKVRISREEYVKNKSKNNTPKHSHKEKQVTSNNPFIQCSTILSNKVTKNMHEYYHLAKYKNRKQALAVSYQQTYDKYPICKLYLRPK